MTEKFEVVFVEERPTKNTIRFAEEAEFTEDVVSTIYIRKWALEQMGNPRKIRITIEPAE